MTPPSPVGRQVLCARGAPCAPPYVSPCERTPQISLAHPLGIEPVFGRDLKVTNLDKVLFAVAAAMALGFVAWGFVSPTGLGSASGSALTWITGNLGWLALITFVVGGAAVNRDPSLVERVGADLTARNGLELLRRLRSRGQGA